MDVGRIIAVAALVGLVNGLAVAAPFAWRWLSGPDEAAAPARVVVAVEDRLSHYSVRGSTAQELLREMARKGPSRYWAYTRYTIEPDFDAVRLPDGRCAMSGTSVTFDVTIRMPRLGMFHGAPACLEARFGTLYTRLLAHEMEHRRIGLQAAEAYADALEGFGSRESCEALERDAVQALREILHETDRQQARFDRETDHGMRGGALGLEDCVDGA